MCLADDVDLPWVAKTCEYFTGADLKALLYNAQLSVVHESMADLGIRGNSANYPQEIVETSKPQGTQLFLLKINTLNAKIDTVNRCSKGNLYIKTIWLEGQCVEGP